MLWRLKNFLYILRMGIAHAWNINFGHAQYCSDNLDQNNCANGVYKIPS